MTPSYPPPPGTHPSHAPPGWGAPPPPKKSGGVLRVVLILGTLMFGSCASYCGYIVYKSETPEGKRAAKEYEDQKKAAVAGFVEKAKRVHAIIPPTDAPDIACPAGTKTEYVPVADSLYFSVLLDGETGKARAEKLSQSDLIRNANSILVGSSFSTGILDAVLARSGVDAGPDLFRTEAADIEQIEEKRIVLYIDVGTLNAPDVQGSSFIGGDLDGALNVLDWKTEKVLCRTRITAASSAQISYGGGVRMKVMGIPSPSVGGSDFDDAVRKDFKTNVAAAIKASLKVIQH